MSGKLVICVRDALSEDHLIRMDMSTRWAPLSYMKIEVAPKTLANGEKTDAFDPSVLHVWPRKDFLLIAPSNAVRL